MGTKTSGIMELAQVQRQAIDKMRPQLIEKDKEIDRLNGMLDALYGELGRMTFEKMTYVKDER